MRFSLGYSSMELFLKNGFPSIILFVLGKTKNFSLNGCFAMENVNSIWPRTGISCPEANLTLFTSEGGGSGVPNGFSSW